MRFKIPAEQQIAVGQLLAYLHTPQGLDYPDVSVLPININVFVAATYCQLRSLSVNSFMMRHPDYPHEADLAAKLDLLTNANRHVTSTVKFWELRGEVIPLRSLTQ